MSQSPKTTKTKDSRDGQPQTGGHLQIVSGGVSLFLLVVFVVACLWIDLERGDAPAHLETTVRTAPEAGAPIVLVEVRNVGDVTAEDVLIRVEGTGGTEADPVEETINFIAPGETKEFTLPRTNDATVNDVNASAVAWVDAR